MALALILLCGCATTQQPPTPTPPPCSAPEHRQFDFWIGEWEVTLPGGNTAGHNRIESIERGCVLAEYWTGAKGGTGRSYNVYDAAGQRWHQTWVDASGTLLLLDGGLRDGKMVLEGKSGDTHNRITWTPLPDGSVTQVWESSKDGKSWTTVFDGLYRKK